MINNGVRHDGLDTRFNKKGIYRMILYKYRTKLRNGNAENHAMKIPEQFPIEAIRFQSMYPFHSWLSEYLLYVLHTCYSIQ